MRHGPAVFFLIATLLTVSLATVLSIRSCAERGVELKWFGGDEPNGFTSAHTSWRYLRAQQLPRTDRVLASLFDMRLPLTFSLEDCAQIARIIADEVRKIG